MTAIIKDKENREKNIAALCVALKDDNIRKEYSYEINYIIMILGVLNDKKVISNIADFMFYDGKTGNNFVNENKRKGDDIFKLELSERNQCLYELSQFGLDALPAVWEKISKTTPSDRSEDGGCAIYMALKILEWAKIDNGTALKSLEEYRQSKTFSNDESKALDELAEAVRTRDDSKIKSSKEGNK